MYEITSIEKTDKGVRTYSLINGKASSNMWVQGITGAVGFPYTAIFDVGVIGTHYLPMFNEIRNIYERPPLEFSYIAPLCKSIAPELLYDFVFDKLMGNIPIVGIPLNAICAKAMTWRLGILFSMLSSRGDEIDENAAKEAVIVIRGVFPKTPFGFDTPSMNDFIGIVNSVFEMPQNDFMNRLETAKAVLMGL